MFTPFTNGQLPFVSSSTNGRMANFRLHEEQSVNGLRKIAWASVFRFSFETAAYILKRQHI
jgi:hypothetical protein